MTKSDARYVKSRQAIIEAGIDVLLENPGAGMSEIALAAGVGRATLYRHFDTREVLIDALVMACLQETDDALRPIKEDGLTGMAAILASIDVIVPMATRYRFLMSPASTTVNSKEVRDAYKSQLEELSTLVAQAKSAGEISSELPNVWIVASYDALLLSTWDLIQRRQMSLASALLAFKHSFQAITLPEKDTRLTQ